MEKMDFFRGLSEKDDKEEAINRRFSEIRLTLGDKILPKVEEARKKGDEKLVKILQDKAERTAQIIVALEFGLIPSREESNGINLRDGDWEDPDFDYEAFYNAFREED